jgi:hypothetical protein
MACVQVKNNKQTHHNACLIKNIATPLPTGKISAPACLKSYGLRQKEAVHVFWNLPQQMRRQIYHPGTPAVATSLTGLPRKSNKSDTDRQAPAYAQN